jgi:hypothetical protein
MTHTIRRIFSTLTALLALLGAARTALGAGHEARPSLVLRPMRTPMQRQATLAHLSHC